MIPTMFQNFPNQPRYSTVEYEFNRASDLSDWEWMYSGHIPPEALSDGDGGSIVLGSGSANANDYLQGQLLGSTIQLNRLSKIFQFEWQIQLDSATLTQALIGICITNTNLMGTNITDGFGLYVNAPGGPADSNWHVFNSFDSAVQFTGYQGYSGPAADTLAHTFSVQVITDPVTLGAGSMTFFMDGNQIGNGIASSAAIFPSDEKLRLSMAMGNGSAVARTLTVNQARVLDQR